MFLDEFDGSLQSKSEVKHKVSIKFPSELWGNMRDMAKEHYSGRGKISQLVNDALEHFLNNLEVDRIDWDNPEGNDNFIELVTQIRLGAQMKNLNPHAVQVFIKDEIMNMVIDVDASIRGAKRLMQYHIRPALIRRAASQWMHADKQFLDRIKGLK
tara:strand:- start:945 stop:1412 length:468 start_codon:yes stop_codon:yes gene_type:complete